MLLTLLQSTGTPAPLPVDVRPPRPGDDEGKRQVLRIVKPTGLPFPKPFQRGRKTVYARVQESADIQAEIAGRLAREFSQENATLRARAPVVEMSMVEVEREIGALLRKKVRTDEDEILLLILIAACA